MDPQPHCESGWFAEQCLRPAAALPFTVVDISATLSVDSKFNGAAAAPNGGVAADGGGQQQGNGGGDGSWLWGGKRGMFSQ